MSLFWHRALTAPTEFLIDLQLYDTMRRPELLLFIAIFVAIVATNQYTSRPGVR